MKLEINNIHKYFEEFHVLNNVGFSVESGRAMGFLGRNGAGKTTTIRIIMDVFRSDEGSITIDGKPFDRSKFRIGYLPEERGMYSKVNVLDQLIYFAQLRGMMKNEAKESALHWIDRFGLKEYSNKKLDTLSKGNQQKIQIAQAFVNNPEILILDEPFSGLDPVNAQLFKEALSEFIKLGRIVIFSSHQMSYVETFCDDVALIDHGEIILKGSLSQIKAQRGENKMRIRFNDFSREQTFKILETFPLSFEEDSESIIVSFLENYTKQSFQKDVNNLNLPIALLADYQPSLEQIFIAEVGEQHA